MADKRYDEYVGYDALMRGYQPSDTDAAKNEVQTPSRRSQPDKTRKAAAKRVEKSSAKRVDRSSAKRVDRSAAKGIDWSEPQSIFARIPTVALLVVSLLAIGIVLYLVFGRNDEPITPPKDPVGNSVPGLLPGGDGVTQSTVVSAVPADVLVAAATKGLADWQAFGMTGNLELVKGSFLQTGRQYASFTREAPQLQQKPSTFAFELSNPLVYAIGANDDQVVQGDVKITTNVDVQTKQWKIVLRRDANGAYLVENIEPLS